MLTHAIFWVGWIATWFDWPPVVSGLDLVGAGFHVSTGVFQPDSLMLAMANFEIDSVAL